MTDEASCYHISKRFRHASLLLKAGSSSVKMPVAFALHHDEGSLRHVIDETLRILDDNHFFDRDLREHPSLAELIEAGVVDRGGRGTGKARPGCCREALTGSESLSGPPSPPNPLSHKGRGEPEPSCSPRPLWERGRG